MFYPLSHQEWNHQEQAVLVHLHLILLLVFRLQNQRKKDISLNRFWAWKKFEKDALRWFKAMGKDYDAVYLTLPSPIIAKKIRSLCDAFKSKLIIDVNDLWPDSLRLFFKNDIVYNLLTYPIQKQVRVGYANADGIVAVFPLDMSIELIT